MYNLPKCIRTDACNNEKERGEKAGVKLQVYSRGCDQKAEGWSFDTQQSTTCGLSLPLRDAVSGKPQP
ncbi:hypothetical protein DBV15_05186 [Temnothorax longispinosus]|uniref:Uncharacterized protein n=1 Tax=Temnothorax longispinosus TaxID=300112 RepID=A0A4S2KTI3_9HYME|nr:hypothetical protein DBV15_05186 [Temnothorax longispinosus]